MPTLQRSMTMDYEAAEAASEPVGVPYYGQPHSGFPYGKPSRDLRIAMLETRRVLRDVYHSVPDSLTAHEAARGTMPNGTEVYVTFSGAPRGKLYVACKSRAVGNNDDIYRSDMRPDDLRLEDVRWHSAY